MYIKKILWAIALIGLAIFAVISYYIYGAMFKPNTKFSTNTTYIYITSTDSYTNVRKQLEPLLHSMSTFDALAKQKKYTTNIKPGKYAIKKGMSNNDIINSIRSKNLPIKVTFNNQNSIHQLAGRIAQQIEADSITLVKTMLDTTFLKAQNFNSNTALGMYLPNSYELFWNTTAEQFRDRMLKEYSRFWTKARLEKAKQINLSPNQVITLASIVYEESKQKQEQPRVAGVYINRLRVGMPLQADPTLKYAAYQLPQYKGKVIKRVLNIHKTIDSPYNTYRYKGLPPGLIAMPDLSAINAVLNYEKHKYLYFAANPKRLGYHNFATSLSQHNANARAYHKYLNTNGIQR